MDNLIEVQHISIAYGNKSLFKDFSFSIKKGNFVALTGNNGSGKSTLIKAILEIISYSGQIVRNTDSIGYLPQSYSIDRSFPITVEEFINLVSNNNKTVKPSRRIEKYLTDVFKELQIEELKQKYLSELSQGQFQKVLFARSIVNNPEFLIQDEPLSNIDEETAVFLKNYLIDLNKKGVTILLSIHDSKFVSETCHQILSLASKESTIVDPCFHNHGGNS
ncbi:MAG: ATP-binding cassette domain-containing protein [Bdellovibrionales bacterium]|nr:ATP-binding cassette domain-containing protein [Bdellovibrionales bacterium]